MAVARKFGHARHAGATGRSGVRSRRDGKMDPSRRNPEERGTTMETCANCGRTIGNLETPAVWNGSVVCADCHGILERQNKTAQPAAATQPNPHACPHCGSSQTASLRVIYQGGVSVGGATGVGVGLHSVAVFAGGGQSQSALSARASPPLKKGIISPVLMGLFFAASAVVSGAVCISSALHPDPYDQRAGETGIIAFGLAVTAIFWFRSAASKAAWNSKELPSLYREWSMCWMCQQCGKVFKVK